MPDSGAAELKIAFRAGWNHVSMIELGEALDHLAGDRRWPWTRGDEPVAGTPR